VGIKKTGLFETLKTGVDLALSECGISPVEQPFRAHLTLGRVRSLKDIQRFYTTIESMRESFSHRVLLDRLVFYRSELGSGGPVYTPLEELVFRD
jgi:2'-5' RNA ligase